MPARVSRSSQPGVSRNKNGKPKRPLSAYNLFFQDERIKLLDSLPEPKCKKTKKSHGKISFADLARTLAEKWKNTPDSTKAMYEELAAKAKRQYALDMVQWAQDQEEKVKTEDDDEEERGQESEKERLDPNSTQDTGINTKISAGEPQVWDVSPQTLVASKEHNSYPREGDSTFVASEDSSSYWVSEPMETGVRTSTQDSTPTTNPSINAQMQWESHPSVTKDYEYVSDNRNLVPLGLNVDVTTRHQPQSTKVDPSVHSSTQLLASLLRQPGIPEFVSQTYNILVAQSQANVAQASPTNAFSPPVRGRLHYQNLNRQENRASLSLPPLMCDANGQARVPDALLGNIEPIEYDPNQRFMEDEYVFDGDVFAL